MIFAAEGEQVENVEEERGRKTAAFFFFTQSLVFAFRLGEGLSILGTEKYVRVGLSLSF
jgi:hypothetical protein